MFSLSISIIVTCHNLHEYLPECMESIKAQTMRATEIIVVHDACEPPPVFPETTTLVRGTHKGVAVSRNEGAALASSGALLFVDADDCLNEYFIEAMVKTKAESTADIIYPNVLLWSSWHKEVKLKNAWHEAPERITRDSMLDYNQLVISSLIPRKLYFQAGGMPDIPQLEDYKFWMTCLKNGATFTKAPQAVLKYRQRSNSRVRTNPELKNEWFYRIKEEYE